LVNGDAVAELVIEQRAVAGYPAIAWFAYDLLTGSKNGVVLGENADLKYANYAQRRSVHAGRNRISIRIRQPPGGAIKAASLLPGTSIAVAPLAPAQVNMAFAVDKFVAQVGHSFAVTYRIDDTGLPALEIGFAIQCEPLGLVTVPAPAHFWEWVTEAKGTVHLVGLRRGKYTCLVHERGRTGIYGLTYPVKVLRLRVVASPRS
jgi:hypothetical protein